MSRQLPTFPDLPAVIYTVTLDAARYRVRLTWRERQQAWYLDLYDQAETPIALGRRLSGRFSPLAGVLQAGQPEGAFLVMGDLRARADLGTEDGRLLYFPLSEIPAEQADDLGIRVSV